MVNNQWKSYMHLKHWEKTYYHIEHWIQNVTEKLANDDLKKWHWIWPPLPLVKYHFYSYIQNLIISKTSPLFVQCHSFYHFFYFEVSSYNRLIQMKMISTFLVFSNKNFEVIVNLCWSVICLILWFLFLYV